MIVIWFYTWYEVIAKVHFYLRIKSSMRHILFPFFRNVRMFNRSATLFNCFYLWAWKISPTFARRKRVLKEFPLGGWNMCAPHFI